MSGASGSITAGQMYKSRGKPDAPFARLPWNRLPELSVRTAPGYSGFNGELKTLPPVAWDDALTYVCFSMLDSLFPVCDGAEIYHLSPPYGHGLIAVAGNGLFTVVEWVGRLFITQNENAVNDLDIRPAKKWVELPLTKGGELSTYPEDTKDSGAEIIWATTPTDLHLVSDDGAPHEASNSRIVKIITLNAFRHLSEANSSHRFRHLHRVCTMCS